MSSDHNHGENDRNFSFIYFYGMPSMSPTMSIFVNKSTNQTLSYNETLLEIDNWLTILLSSVSMVALIVFTVLYILAKVKNKSKDSKRVLFKKVFKKEHLIFSYCTALFFSHFVSIAHTIIGRLLNPSEPGDDFSSSSSSFTFVNGSAYCLSIGILRQFFWLSTILHTNSISFKMYFRLSKTLNENLLNKRVQLKSAIQCYSYIYGITALIVIASVLVHFTASSHPVYDIDLSNKLYCCFLSKPIYLVALFALPVALILVINFTLFIIVMYRTKPTFDQQNEAIATINSDSSENANNNHGPTASPSAAVTPTNTNNLFLKLAVIMGLSWAVYIVSVIFIETFTDYYAVQVFIIIASSQVNLQGLIVAIGLFFNVVYEKFVKNRRHCLPSQNSAHNNHHNQRNRLNNLPNHNMYANQNQSQTNHNLNNSLQNNPINVIISQHMRLKSKSSGAYTNKPNWNVVISGAI
jgi:hypothetical protein